MRIGFVFLIAFRVVALNYNRCFSIRVLMQPAFVSAVFELGNSRGRKKAPFVPYFNDPRLTVVVLRDDNVGCLGSTRGSLSVHFVDSSELRFLVNEYCSASLKRMMYVVPPRYACIAYCCYVLRDSYPLVYQLWLMKLV